MVKLIGKIKDLEGVDTLNLNLGGGLGVKYLESDSPPSIENFVNLIVDNVENEVRKKQSNDAQNFNRTGQIYCS